MTSYPFSILPWLLLFLLIREVVMHFRRRFNREARSRVKTIVLAFILVILFIGLISIGYLWTRNLINLMRFAFILVLFILAFGKKIEEDRVFIMSEGPIGFVNIEALKG